MAKKLLCAAGLAALAAFAASAPPVAPLAGIVRGTDHTLHRIYGFSGNLISGPPLPVHDVLLASFSSQAGIVLCPGAIQLIGIDGSVRGSYPTSEAQPVISIADSPETAVAWLPGEQRLVRWTGSGFAASPLDSSKLPGTIIALEQSGSDVLDAWVQTQSSVVQHVRVSLGTGQVSPLESIAGVGSSVAVLGSTIIYHDAEGIEIRTPNSRTRTLALPLSDVTFEKASIMGLHISSPSSRRQWMLMVSANDARLSELPALVSVSQEAAQ